MQRRLFLIVVLTIVIVSQVTVLSARSLTIESFHSDINVFPDGTIRVDEKIRFRFSGSWNGIYRKIPVQYYTPMGFSYCLWLQLQSITDETGHSLRYESSREGSYRKLKVWVPGANNAVRTVVLGYRVKNALRFFEEKEDFAESRDELFLERDRSGMGSAY